MDTFVKIIKNSLSLIFSFINEIQEIGCIENSSMSCSFVNVTDVNVILSFTNSLRKLLVHLQEAVKELECSHVIKSNILPGSSNQDKNIASTYPCDIQILNSSKVYQNEAIAKINRFKEKHGSIPYCQQQELLTEEKEQSKQFATSVSYQDELGSCLSGNLIAPHFENHTINGQVIPSSFQHTENRNNCQTELRDSELKKKEGMKSRRRGIKSHTCISCSRVFRNLKNLSIHLKKFHSDEESNNMIEEFNIESEPKTTLPLYCCKTCNSASKNYSKFRSHLCRLPNDDGNQIVKQALITNVRKLQNMKKFFCDTCGVEFRALKRILYHLPRCFPGPYLCNSCSNTFVSLKDLNYHKKKDHKNEKCFVCDECGKSFLRKASLRKHCIKKHEFEDSVENKEGVSYKCDLCPKKFIKKIFLTNHKLRMHGLEKKFLCQVCGKKFMSNHSLTIHIDIHKGEKKFGCQYCTKKFQRKEKLLHHERTHTGERPFKCDRCEKAFVSRARLNQHIRRHEADKRFECSQCDKTYASSWDLKKHMLKKHNMNISTESVKVSLKMKNEKVDSSHEQIYEETHQHGHVHLPHIIPLNSAADVQQVQALQNQSCQMHHIVQVEQPITMSDTIPVIIHPAVTPINLVSFGETLELEGHCSQPLLTQTIRNSQIIYSPQSQNQMNYSNS